MSKSDEVQIAVIVTKVDNIEKSLDRIEGLLVSKEEFVLVKKVVFGFVGLVLTIVLVAILALVVIKKPV